MKRLSFSQRINASQEKVWQTLWSPETYPLWTAAFQEGSYAESTWNEGDEVRFLGPDGSGMLAEITRKIVPFQMLFTHKGVLDKGAFVPQELEASNSWAGAEECYDLRDENGQTVVEVTMDVTEEFEQCMTDGFHKALERLKSVAEA